ncbi:Dipeptidyl aminopeptidase/acylaminoacyl peptidase [Neorhodopirellula lusitana]|uniref:Dipeptidyl aminopeptidase/acylaminoacyl peptidase n=1 Tax=Neorhodopirellula lusitana TaxID=445327 RepID=A0ABY1PN72_9BACT|nr:prolyl oligopeptidase family serine peptidase [Neorhodopirellula lusitana]SMP38813.1 Dipeptidyl aminopeptidase/acylaminoacyl peptidase [Neorhodopirellula lusitana]
MKLYLEYLFRLFDLYSIPITMLMQVLPLKNQSSNRMMKRSLTMTHSKIQLFVFGVICVLSFHGHANCQGTVEDYEAWRSYSKRVQGRVFRDRIEPHWVGEDDGCCWYRVQAAKGSSEFVFVDAVRGKRETVRNFDEVKERIAGRDRDGAADMPASLTAQSEVARSRDGSESATIRFHNQTAGDLNFYWVQADGQRKQYGTIKAKTVHPIQTYVGHAWLLQDPDGENVASFVASAGQEDAWVDGDTPKPRVRRRDRRRAGRTNSPDGKYRVQLVDHNVQLIDTVEDKSTQLTQDGSAENSFGGRVWWSPTSEHFVVFQTKQGRRRTISLVESSPEDSIHSRLITIPYAKPGDELDHPTVVLFSRQDDWQPRRIDDKQFANPFSIRDVSWNPDGDSFSFLYNERGHQRLRLISVDAGTGKPTTTVDETSETFVCYSSKSFAHYVESTNQWIWMSERSGWNHLYLIDADTTEVVNPITSGEWVVRSVEHVDEENGRLMLSVSGMDPKQDPYHVHWIRINFDGSNLVQLTDGDGDHEVTFSPGDRYLIDRYSRVDMPPVTNLRDAETGELVCELEAANASELLETGWQPPERFVAAGRDGKTDIHGIIVRPTDFDPEKRYPVLEAIYAGPHSAFVPKRFGVHSSLYSMAELGFIVVKIDGMGTNHRSKAFHDVCWKNLADSGFPDRVAWMKAAASTRPEMDLTRVGIWGGSAGGQSAMRALIDHGDFYHAAAADCGCHDNRVDKIWWNEQWMGWPIGPHYQAQSSVTGAKRLQGDLLLIWGELDRNVDPASSMQVVNALIAADKDFEQLIVPGAGHGAAGHPYAHRRQADFFVRKLWIREPRTPEIPTPEPQPST